ncbi:MAG: hypothetical protein ABEI52_04810, partial [Halobacteriaceae archaeon]
LHCGGPERFTYNEIVELVTDVPRIHVPEWLIRIPTYLFQYQHWYPLSTSMLDMLCTDTVVRGENVDAQLDINLQSVRPYLEQS